MLGVAPCGDLLHRPRIDGLVVDDLQQRIALHLGRDPCLQRFGRQFLRLFGGGAQGGVDLDGVLDGKEEKIVRSSPKYEPRFKIVEWIERLREYLREGSEEDGLETDYFTVTKVDQESTTESKTKPLSIWQGLFPLLWDGQADGREGRLAI